MLKQWRDRKRNWSLISTDLIVYSRTGWDRHSPEGKGYLGPGKALHSGE